MSSALVFLLTKSEEKNTDTITTTFVDDKLDDFEVFVTYENIKAYKWYVLEMENKDIIISRLSTITTEKIKDSYANDDIRKYYYTNALENENLVYPVLYNKTNKTFWQENNEEIISATPLTYFLEKYDFEKEKYSKEDIENVLKNIKSEYNQNKKLSNKEKILIKDNSMY